MKRENEIVVILGKKGSGKTSLARNLIKDARRLVVFDFNREYEGFYIVTTPPQLLEIFKLNLNADFRVCYQPAPEIDLDEHFAFLSSAIFAMPEVTFLCEEIDLVSSAGEMPDGLKKIINYGRHRGINLIGLSRRAHKVPRDLTANADKIYTFSQYEPRDIRYLADYMGETAATEVQTLNRTDTGAEFILWNNGVLGGGKVNFLDKSVFDLYTSDTKLVEKNLTAKPQV